MDERNMPRDEWEIPRRSRKRMADNILRYGNLQDESSDSETDIIGHISPPTSPIPLEPVAWNSDSDADGNEQEDGPQALAPERNSDDEALGAERDGDYALLAPDREDIAADIVAAPPMQGFPDFDYPVRDDDDGNDDFEDENDDNVPIEDEVPVNDEPLFPGATITQAESFLAILSFAVRHKLNGACVSDLIGLIDLHCPKPKSSFYAFQKHFEEIRTPLERQYFCQTCTRRCNEENMCEHCGPTKVNYLILFPITTQLEKMFSRRGFYDSLSYRFTRQKLNANNIEDIYDGQLYKDQVNNGFLRDQSAISFLLYTDGVPVFKSSNVSIWPMYLKINELPCSERSKKENVVLPGLWIGPTKLVQNVMLQPIRVQMADLYVGVPVMTADIGRTVLKGDCIRWYTADLPATELLLNINQHSGEYSCPKCLIKGERVENVQVCPYSQNISLRTGETMARDVNFALQLPLDHADGHINGVKGPTELANFIPNFIRAMALDEKHCVQGVVRKIVMLLFESSYHTYNFNRSVFLRVVDARFLKIQAPEFIKRKPRSLKDHLAHFKMSELKSLFLFYSLVVLKGVISLDHSRHLMLLITAVVLLSGRSISHDDIDLSERLIHEFVRTFSDLYDVKFHTINVHQLLHLPSVVRDLGPLWATSCFSSEDLNGELLSLVHGTRFSDKQICSSVQRYLALPLLVSNLPDGSPCKAFCSEMISSGKKINITEEIGEGVGIVGVCNRLNLIPAHISQAFTAALIPFTNVFEFHRLFKSGRTYTTSSYCLGKRSDSSCITFINNHGERKVGVIKAFVKILLCECRHSGCEHNSSYHVLVNPCRKINSFVSAEQFLIEVPHVSQYELTDEVCVIQPINISGMNVIMRMDEGIYIAEPPVMTESNV